MLEIWDRGVNASGRCTAECQARPSLRSVWEAQRGGLGRLLTYQKPEMINGQGSWRYPHEDYSLATISLGQRLPEGTQAWLNMKTKPQDPWDRVEFRRGEAVAWPARVADILTGGVLREAPHSVDGSGEGRRSFQLLLHPIHNRDVDRDATILHAGVQDFGGNEFHDNRYYYDIPWSWSCRGSSEL